jgi:hypothetical protein
VGAVKESSHTDVIRTFIADPGRGDQSGCGDMWGGNLKGGDPYRVLRRLGGAREDYVSKGGQHPAIADGG